MRLSSFAVAFWAVLMMTGQADSPKLPLYPIGGSFASYIDEDGYVNPILNVGLIDFGNGLLLPLALNFSSAIRSPSPEFGQGWDCPLFEAKIFDVHENMKQVELLGGKKIYLNYDQRTDSWKHVFSDHWTGHASGDDFDLFYDSIYKFTFHNGLISSLHLPSGRTILWNREGDKLISMNEMGKPLAMQMVYDHLGFAKQILLNPSSLGVAGKYYSFGSNLTYAGIDKIECPDGRTISLVQSHDKALNDVLDLTDTKAAPMKLTWDKMTGQILTDNFYVYKMEETAANRSFPKMYRTNKGSKSVESFYFDPLHGTTDQLLAEGTMRHTEMSQAPGPNYKAIRLIEETKNGVTQVLLRRSFDDNGRLLQETIGLANGAQDIKQYLYDDGGRAVSFIWNGQEVWKNVYDSSTGQLLERDLPTMGVKMVFDQLPGGEMKESVEQAGGSIVSAQTFTSNNWQLQANFMESFH